MTNKQNNVHFKAVLKQWLLILTVFVTVGKSTETIINIPDGTWMAIVPQTCISVSSFTIDCSSQPIIVPLPIVSTGPFIFKAWNSSDCFKVDKVNSNGTTTPAPPFPWIKCPT